MKIALVTSYPPGKITLAEYGYHLTKNLLLHEEIDELVLLTDRTEKNKLVDFESGNFKLKIHECWSFNRLNNVFSIMKAIHREAPDVILFNLQFMKFGDKKVAAALCLFLPMICKYKGIPTIVLLHNIMECVDLNKAGITNNAIYKWVYNHMGSVLTRIILQSDLVAVTLEKYVSILKNKYHKENIVLIPHGSFHIYPKPSFGIPEGNLKVMAFGKFGTYKKVELLIEAVKQIRSATGEMIELVIAGTDSPNAKGYLDLVQKSFKDVSNLIFTGYLKEEEIPLVFSDCAVVVFPYTSTTGSSGVLHQAGAYGKAVVLPNLGDLNLLIREEGYAGEFFEPTSVESLAFAIKKVIFDNTYNAELGRINHSASNKFPMKLIAEMYVNNFRLLLSRKLNKNLVGDV